MIPVPHGDSTPPKAQIHSATARACSTSLEHYDIGEREVIPTPVSLRRGFRNRSLANSAMQRTGNHGNYQPGYLPPKRRWRTSGYEHGRLSGWLP